MPVTTEPATWRHLPGWAGPVANPANGQPPSLQQVPRTGAGLDRQRAASEVRRFATYVRGLLRTCGVALYRPGRAATDLAGVDIQALAVLARGAPGASAQGKLVVVGGDGAAVFQTEVGKPPEPALCGNGASAVLKLLNVDQATFDMFGPAASVVRVAQRRVGDLVEQSWALPGFHVEATCWRGRQVLKAAGLNAYAVLLGDLPDDVAPEQARRELLGPGLATKLMIVNPAAGALPNVAFFNSNGRHGAAPATGLATLAILVERVPALREILGAGLITYATASGEVTAALPAVTTTVNGSVSVSMPTVEVRLSDLSASGDA